MRTRFGTVLAAAMIAGVALVIGGVAGWFARSVREREIGAREGRAFTSAVAESLKEPVVSGKDAADKSELAALRMRRRELERKIAATVAVTYRAIYEATTIVY